MIPSQNFFKNLSRTISAFLYPSCYNHTYVHCFIHKVVFENLADDWRMTDWLIVLRLASAHFFQDKYDLYFFPNCWGNSGQWRCAEDGGEIWIYITLNFLQESRQAIVLLFKFVLNQSINFLYNFTWNDLANSSKAGLPSTPGWRRFWSFSQWKLWKINWLWSFQQ